MAEEPRPFGAYVLLKALGRGAMGDVHLARPYNPNRGIPTPVVIKRLHGELASKKGFVARFRHEASLAVSVDSRHVARVFDVGAVGSTLYIVMEYVPGWPLSRVLDAILKSGRHASIASVVDSIAGGLEGLDSLHTARDPKTAKPLGIVHRDISPKNLMIGEDGLMRLIDLGLGKSNAQDWKTRTGVVMGSVGYMPPEQAAGEHVDARADVYALGVVAFEMLAFRNYIKRGPLAQMMESSMRPRFVRPSEYRPDVPPGLDEVIERAVEPKKEDRFQSARAFLEALRAVVPSTHTEGGMASLVEDLFGDTRAEREREIEGLLRLPLPIEDPGEFEPTKVFVQRAGVRPPDERHVDPTQVQPAELGDATSGPPITVATELTWSDGPPPLENAPPGFDVRTKADPIDDPAHSPARHDQPRTAPPPPNAYALSDFARSSAGGAASSVAVGISGGRGAGVSLAVLLASVVMAALVGAIVAVVVSQSILNSGMQSAAPAPRIGEPVEPTPVAVRRGSARTGVDEPSGASEDEEESPHAAAQPIAVKKRRPVAHGERGAPEASPPSPRPPPEYPSPPPDLGKPGLDAEFSKLVKKTEALIARLPDGPKKEKAIAFKMKVRMNSSSQDLQILRQNVERLEREFRDLEW